MKKMISIILMIALLAVSAAALADGNTQGSQPGGMPQQGQMNGPMAGGPNQGNRPNGPGPNGQAPNGKKPADAPERPSGEKSADAPELPSGEKPVMIDFDAMVTKGVISQGTCDKIKAYMEEHKPADLPNGQPSERNGEKPADLPEGQTPETNGEKPAGLPEGQAPETNSEKPAGLPEGQAPAEGGLLADLLKDGIITQAEYNALIAEK